MISFAFGRYIAIKMIIIIVPAKEAQYIDLHPKWESAKPLINRAPKIPHTKPMATFPNTFPLFSSEAKLATRGTII